MPKNYGTALVTGGGSGIGRAAALALAQRGARLAVTDRDADKASTVAQEITAAGAKAIGMAMDVGDAASIAAGFDRAEAALGGIDILINSAGLMLVEPLLDFSPESWDRVMRVNVTGTFLASQRAARGMAERGYGRIINLTSVSGLRAGIGRTAYGTSKAAIIGLTRQFALELGPLGVTVNAIAPGAIETPMTLGTYSEETWENILAMVPARRRGTPQDIAEAIAYLASPAASYVNGETLTVDGGYMAAGMTQTGRMRI
ncbi:SDR family NAD(P)-dependent oxidoreductase [Thauera sp. Sel9]|uniref:SDR family NAD(P)-dependent oxidoreductase n=1 Tax=Thauera sp. Sel9 TaxID=2974299 RepID=UPI0021E1A3ED|nr:SDR family NAD(P)-dependent oxidoreductase [Thauera sp. Sel9]MCV2218671.1 SDR family oxidoreductase [Thauera sp. Sel9]